MEDLNFNHRRCLAFNCCVWQPERALVEHDAVQPSSPVLIHIDFVSQTSDRWMTHDGRGPQLIEYVPDVLSDCVDARVFTSFDESSEYVTGKLSALGIHPRFHGLIAQEVIASGRSMGNSVPENVGPQILPLRVEITMVNIYIREGESIESALMRESRTEFESGNYGNYYGMVPASERSGRELKKKRVEKREGEICSVCLDELPSGFVVTAMPCSHLFHHDCINTWLNISHFCPVCRFEMPTV